MDIMDTIESLMANGYVLGAKPTDRPPNKEMQVIEIDRKQLFDTVLYFMYDEFSAPDKDMEMYVDTLRLMMKVLHDERMLAAALGRPVSARAFLGAELFNKVADMVNHGDVFAIVVKNGDEVFTVATPALE